MAIIRTLPEKDSTEGYETEFDRNSDAADMRGAYLQNDVSNDATVLVSRDASDNLTFTDPVVGVTKTLTDLLAGGGGASALALNKHVLSANFTVTAAYGVVVPRYIEIAAGITLTLGDDADLEIS